jgi:hypothetical protein
MRSFEEDVRDFGHHTVIEFMLNNGVFTDEILKALRWKP